MSKRTADDTDLALPPSTKTPIEYEVSKSPSPARFTVERVITSLGFKAIIKRDLSLFTVDFLCIKCDIIRWDPGTSVDVSRVMSYLKTLNESDGWHVTEHFWGFHSVVPTIAENIDRQVLRDMANYLLSLVTYLSFVPTLKALAMQKMFQERYTTLTLMIARYCGGPDVLASAAAEFVRPDKRKLDVSNSESSGSALQRWYHAITNDHQKVPSVRQLLQEGAHVVPDLDERRAKEAIAINKDDSSADDDDEVVLCDDDRSDDNDHPDEVEVDW